MHASLIQQHIKRVFQHDQKWLHSRGAKKDQCAQVNKCNIAVNSRPEIRQSSQKMKIYPFIKSSTAS